MNIISNRKTVLFWKSYHMYIYCVLIVIIIINTIWIWINSYISSHPSFHCGMIVMEQICFCILFFSKINLSINLNYWWLILWREIIVYVSIGDWFLIEIIVKWLTVSGMWCWRWNSILDFLELFHQPRLLFLELFHQLIRRGNSLLIEKREVHNGLELESTKMWLVGLHWEKRVWRNKFYLVYLFRLIYFQNVYYINSE